MREAQDSSFLLRGKDLREAERWVAKSAENDPKPTTLHSQFILASRQAAIRLQRITIGAIAVAFLIAVGLAVLAFIQKNVAQDQTAAAQRNARESRARELSTFALESRSDDPEKSILLAMQAVNATLQYGQPPVPVAEDGLHQAISSSPVRLTLKGHTGGVYSVAWSPDGKRLATGSRDGTAKVWDAASGKELLTLKGSYVTSVAWSPDGKWLATADGQTAKVWETASGKELLTLRGHNDNVKSIALSPEGKRLATGSDDGTARVWDAASGKEALTLSSHTSHNVEVNSVAWSPDGQWLATGGSELCTFM